jgi:hypothetical protein
MKTMPRGIPSYFYVDILKIGYNNYELLKLFILLFSKIIIHADVEMRWTAGNTLGANGRANNTVFFTSTVRRKRTHVDTDLRLPLEMP